MSKQTTEAIVDSVLKLLVSSSGLAAAIIAPNVLQSLNKPFGVFLKTMDKRQQEREIRRVLYYMKQRDLISGEYDHGLKITNRGKKRLESSDESSIFIPHPNKWDKRWRLVFYDIPESHKLGRDALTRKLKSLGFYPLQRSVLVHPFPCRKQIEQVTQIYDINSYVSYIETDHIDQEKLLIKKFSSIL
jgi:DNA-binding transcriptional regulator PaaX